MIKQIVGFTAISILFGVAIWQWMPRGKIAAAGPSAVFPEQRPAAIATKRADNFEALETLKNREARLADSSTPTFVAPVVPPTVPGPLQRIGRPDANAKFAERLEAVKQLGAKLTSEEIKALYDYLLMPNSATAAGHRSEELLRNNLMNRLAEQETLPADFAKVLIRIYNDRRQDAVIRDYAVQHLSAAYARLNDQEQTNAMEAFWQATKERDSSIAGTALLALTQITSESAPAAASPTHLASVNKLAQTVVAVAENDNSGELARITAVSLCGRLHLVEALPITNSLVDSAESIPLRIAAIAALGDFGSPAAKAALERLSVNSDPRLKMAAGSALRRLGK
jgi:hypothetical protein